MKTRILLLLCVACSSDPEEPVTAGTCELGFPATAPWNLSIEDRPVDSESATVVDHLSHWHESSGRFRIDFSFRVLEADASTPRQAFTPTDEFYQPDCDPAPVPLPEGGALEAEDGYACLGDGDCHLLVMDRSTCRLHEMWRANVTADGFFGGCQAVWDLSRVYPETGRGEFCTSADAAGLPIAPLLFDANEVLAGEITHAVRFTLPNTLIRSGEYVRPATHTTPAAQGTRDAPPYGARFRLRGDFDASGLSPAAQVVVRALQKYGMFLADGGKATFTARSDRFTQAKWADTGLDEHHLLELEWSDFEMVDGGERIDGSGGICQREPVLE